VHTPECRISSALRSAETGFEEYVLLLGVGIMNLMKEHAESGVKKKKQIHLFHKHEAFSKPAKSFQTSDRIHFQWCGDSAVMLLTTPCKTLFSPIAYHTRQ